jgi:hypothetical protein
VAESNAPAGTHLGFLTVLQEPSGFLGGFLVTNAWGRPLEFRLSTAVQPNRVQQILYGETLHSYICADLIGKTLLDKTSTPVQLLITDTEAALDLRLRLALPVVCLAGASKASHDVVGACPPHPSSPPQGGREQDAATRLVAHAQFPDDTATARQMLERLDGNLDLTEPFGRIREAIGEARRMGLTGRN